MAAASACLPVVLRCRVLRALKVFRVMRLSTANKMSKRRLGALHLMEVDSVQVGTREGRGTGEGGREGGRTRKKPGGREGAGVVGSQRTRDSLT